MTKAAELAKMGEVLTNSQIGGRRNMVINGAMQVAQRATSATGVGGTNEEYPTIDRFNFTTTSAGRFTMSQEADGPDGFANSMKLACTTADTSISASEALILQTKFEGQDVQRLMYGSSSAQPITVSFYVKGNASATYTLEWRNEEDGRNTGKTFSVTTNWTRVSITFTGDTGGSAVDDDNTHAFTLGIWLHGGTTFSGGTFTENSWHSTNNQRIGDGQTSFLDSTDRTFFITGVQLEVGEQATPFEHRSFGEELALCHRYFQKLAHANGDLEVGSGYETSNSQVNIHYQYYGGQMRANPTISDTSVSEGYRFLSGTSEDNRKTTIPIANQIGNKTCQFVNNQDTVTGGDGARFFLNASTAQISFDAEL